MALPTTIPGPRPMPLVGANGSFIALMLDSAGFLERLFQQFGEIVSLAEGSSKYIFVFSPTEIKSVLSDTSRFQNLNAESSPLRMREGTALHQLYAGLTNMNGARHKQHRRLMAPMLHARRIEGCRDDIVDLVERQVAGWRIGERRDVFEEMRALTLAVAIKTLIGLDPELDGLKMSHLLDRWLGLVFSSQAILLPFDLPGLPYRRLLRLSERLAVELRAMIEQRRACGTRQADVLSALLGAQDEDGIGLTDEELLGQTSFLFMAGHVTTASALTWTLFLLSQHPNVLRDLLDELWSKLQGSAPDVGQLAELPLLESVIKETLRLFPPVIWWGRMSAELAELGPYSVPAGAYVAYSAFVTHRIPAIYPAPTKFLPERWHTFTPGPYEYLPFSGGPRTCLGSAFAMMEMKLILAVLLQRFGLALAPNSRIDHRGMVLSRPKHGMPMSVVRPGTNSRTPIGSGNVRTLVELE